jgi:hypothetical protein
MYRWNYRAAIPLIELCYLETETTQLCAPRIPLKVNSLLCISSKSGGFLWESTSSVLVYCRLRFIEQSTEVLCYYRLRMI